MEILDWDNLTGVHCGSSAIRNVVNFYGYDYPEELCFGLGCGLGFFYNKLYTSKPSEIIHLRAPNMEPLFFSKQGNEYEWKLEKNSHKAFKNLILELDEGNPIFLQTDLFYLKYYNSKIHFPGHVVLCVGYDMKNKNFILSDTNFKELQIVSFSDLDKARSSKAEPYPLNYNWFSIKKFSPFKNLELKIKNSIKLNSYNFLNGQNSLRGTSSIYSILEWLKGIQNWSKYDDSNEIFKFAYQIIAKRGSKGAGFRCIYSDFLKIASSESKKIKVLKLYERMIDIANLWELIALSLKKLSKKFNNNDFLNLKKEIHKVYELELEYNMIVIDKV